MNLRTVTRGDAALAVTALLLLISSFLPYYSGTCVTGIGTCTVNAWHSAFFPLLPSVFFLGLIGAALVLVGRLLPQDPRIAGIQLSHWGTVLAVASLWSALWALIGGPGPSHGVGAYLSFLFTLLLAGAALATPLLPALSLALLPDPAKQVPGPGGYPGYGQPGQPGQPGQQHPYQQSAHHFHHGQPVQQAQPGQPFTGPQAPAPHAAAPEQQGGYGYPNQPGGSFGAAAPAPAPSPSRAAAEPVPAPTPTPQDAPPRQDHATALLTPVVKRQPEAQPAQPSEPRPSETQPAAHAPEPTPATSPAAAQAQAQVQAEPQPEPSVPAFAPFWFAVPAARTLSAEQDAQGGPVGELVPGTWYLAIAQRGDALLTQTQEGKRGLLTDTSGIQRG
ncbi:hypothetical protein ABIA33_003500 [Streptacidiphilus sp. MAP12-16]|uniref:hypothetical protein n=1 Tax=Streptacidiphilus sp. MAP12-16 TaxID=3156300 RepID=UPI0035146A72